MPNRLAAELSPYLRQHAENPVDWYAWGPEAWEQAAAEDKPIFLSIGYSACHWCHVMAHESFEDPAIARLLNEQFISVKIDREERPELDQVYMEAVQLMTGRGGWPLSVFLTPQREPFFGGTYWPARALGGMPGFDQVLQAVADTWRHRRSDALEQARELTRAVQDQPLLAEEETPAALGDVPLRAAQRALLRSFDRRSGGFGSSPKFPPAVNLGVLLRRWRRTGDPELLAPVRVTLDRMAAGGIYDHLGGGFHRYSVDAHWLVPHFEKMLYDNAMLAGAYLEAWQATGQANYARVVSETLDYVLRDMTDPLGGFTSSEDADSQGEEGRFYVWTVEEIRAALGREAGDKFCAAYDVSPAGNFEGRNILNRLQTGLPGTGDDATAGDSSLSAEEAELAESRQKLLAARQQRVRPGRDDKVVVSWNGLMIDALARAGAALASSRYAEAACRAADFLFEHLMDDNGRLRHCWRAGQAKVDGFLDDYAALCNACVSLYEADFQPRWIERAVGLADAILARFADADGGGFFFCAADHEPIIARKKDFFDAPLPSASGLAATALLRLGKLCARGDYLAAAEGALRAAMTWLQRVPTGCGQMLTALDLYLGPTPEIVLAGSRDQDDTRDVLTWLHRQFLPDKVLAFCDAADGAVAHSAALEPLLRGKASQDGGPTLYLCNDHACQEPIRGKQPVLAALAGLIRPTAGQ